MFEAGSGYPTLKENSSGMEVGGVYGMVGMLRTNDFCVEVNVVFTRKFEFGHLLLSSC